MDDFSDRPDDAFRFFLEIFRMFVNHPDQLLKISSDFFADNGAMRRMVVDIPVTVHQLASLENWKTKGSPGETRSTRSERALVSDFF